MAYYKSIVINGTKYEFECAIEGNGAPTSSVDANVGQTYIDLFTEGNPIYWCVSSENGVTQWRKVADSAEIVTNVGGLDDVNVSSPSNNQVLTYNSSTQKWENKDIPMPSGYSQRTNCKILQNDGGYILATVLVKNVQDFRIGHNVVGTIKIGSGINADD